MMTRLLGRCDIPNSEKTSVAGQNKNEIVLMIAAYSACPEWDCYYLSKINLS